jgi:hypothetical protein
MDINNWGYWLPGDIKRCARDDFIGIDVGAWVKPSFTTENTLQVYNIIFEEIKKYR